MKLSVLVWSIACACVTLPAHAQAVRNPLRPAPGAVAAGPTLPETRPGAYIAGKRPLIPPPPPGLPPYVLPPAASTPAVAAPSFTPELPRNSPAAGPAPSGSPKAPALADPAPGDAVAADATDGTAAADAAAKPAKPVRKPSNVFLSRDALQQSRSHCVVERKDKAPLQFAASGGERTVRLRVLGGRACVKALSSSHAWLRVSALSGDNELTVSATENEEPTARGGVVVVANTGSAVRIEVEQAPNTTGFRRIEL